VITLSKLGRYGQLVNQHFQHATLRAMAECIGYGLRIQIRLHAPNRFGRKMGIDECDVVPEEWRRP